MRREVRVAFALPVTVPVAVKITDRSTYCAAAGMALPPETVKPLMVVNVAVSSAVPITYGVPPDSEAPSASKYCACIVMFHCDAVPPAVPLFDIERNAFWRTPRLSSVMT